MQMTLVDVRERHLAILQTLRVKWAHDWVPRASILRRAPFTNLIFFLVGRRRLDKPPLKVTILIILSPLYVRFVRAFSHDTTRRQNPNRPAAGESMIRLYIYANRLLVAYRCAGFSVREIVLMGTLHKSMCLGDNWSNRNKRVLCGREWMCANRVGNVIWADYDEHN